VKAVVVLAGAQHDGGASVITVGDRTVIGAAPRVATDATGDPSESTHAALADVLTAARAVPGVLVRVAVAPGSEPLPHAALGISPGHVFETRGDTAGDRRRFAMADLFRRGAKQVVVLDADYPHVRSTPVQAAFVALDANPTQVVLGPANDGGYYLLGLTGPTIPDLFTGVRWGTRYALMDTLRRCEFEERRVTVLDLLDA